MTGSRGDRDHERRGDPERNPSALRWTGRHLKKYLDQLPGVVRRARGPILRVRARNEFRVERASLSEDLARNLAPTTVQVVGAHR